ncbi:hypothetical protein B9Z52_14585 [Limnohabitans sp. Jir72]|nr:hypothetical protein B9Z52_14585 [Limnohabitans sp. Jir72]
MTYWFKEEENGYSNLGYVDSETDYYPYHLMNFNYGWKYVDGDALKVLGLGSAFGSEFEKVKELISSITIVEPGKKFWRRAAFGHELNYLMPNATGRLDFNNSTFELITVFGVLHHIPNVSYVFSELIRVLKPGGYLLIREPIISMGDWRFPRSGLTKNERGISIGCMNELILQHGMELMAENFIGFSPMQKIMSKLGLRNYWSNNIVVEIDRALCRLFKFNYRYHRIKFLHRFAPSTGYWVVRKK